MKYKYLLKNGKLLAESDSLIKFNTELFPIFKDIEPVEEKAKRVNFYDKDKEEK